MTALDVELEAGSPLTVKDGDEFWVKAGTSIGDYTLKIMHDTDSAVFKELAVQSQIEGINDVMANRNTNTQKITTDLVLLKIVN